MCQQIEATDVRVILCWKQDRLLRNLTDYALLIEGLGIEIISMTEGTVSDDENAIMGVLRAGMARDESKKTSQRVCLGLRTKAERGIWPTYAPTGYLNVKEGVEPDPIAAPLIRRVFERYLHEEIGLTELARWAGALGLRAKHGGRPSRSTIHRMLGRSIYCGKVPWKGAVYEGQHEPIISVEVFNAVQRKLRGKTGPKERIHHFPFRGFLVCGRCGCQITASFIKGKYIYYHCTGSKGRCGQPRQRQEVLSDRLVRVIEGISVPRAVADRAIPEIADEIKHRESSKRVHIIQLKADAQRVSDLRRDAYLDKLENVISPERWASIDQEFAEQAEDIQTRLSEIGRRPTDPAEALWRTFKSLEAAPGKYLRQNHEIRAQMLRSVASNCVIDGEKIEPNYKKPFAVVAECVETSNWRRAIDYLHTLIESSEGIESLVLV